MGVRVSVRDGFSLGLIVSLGLGLGPGLSGAEPHAAAILHKIVDMVAFVEDSDPTRLKSELLQSLGARLARHSAFSVLRRTAAKEASRTSIAAEWLAVAGVLEKAS